MKSILCVSNWNRFVEDSYQKQILWNKTTNKHQLTFYLLASVQHVHFPLLNWKSRKADISCSSSVIYFPPFYFIFSLLAFSLPSPSFWTIINHLPPFPNHPGVFFYIDPLSNSLQYFNQLKCHWLSIWFNPPIVLS